MHGAWKRRLASAALATMAGALLATIAPAAVAEAAGFQQATEVLAPPNAGSPAYPSLRSASCTSAGNCVAVGSYGDSSGNQQVMAVTETSGTWAQAVELIPPSDAGSPADPSMTGVSCPSAGSCIAVGQYQDSSGDTQMMAVTETSGSWAEAVELTPPSNADTATYAAPFGLSCASVGNCVVVGYYQDTSGDSQAMAATESGGTWAQAVEVTPPPGAASNPGANLYAVSCTSAGNCVGVGYYHDGMGHSQAMAATDSGGTWSQAVEVAPPSNAASPAYPNLYGVSCTSSGNCAAVGQYQDASDHSQAMAATETGGTWAQAVEVTPPSNAGSPSYPTLDSVSCAAAGSCVAVGWYQVGGIYQPMAATESGGTWGQAAEVVPPPNAGSSNSYFYGISCTSDGSCAAVGYYRDSSGREQAMAATESTGPAPVDQPLAAQVSAGQLVLSCSAPGSPGYPSTTCSLVNLSTVTLDGQSHTATGNASTIYISDNRGNPAAGWSLSTYMVPSPTNANASCAGLADFCNSSVASNALSADGQIPAADLSASGTTCTASTGNSNANPTASNGSYSAPFTLCTSSAGQSGGTFTMNTNFSLSIPSSVYAGTYDGTVEYLVS